MSSATVGFVGLGNMGSVLAQNLVLRGHDVVTHDTAGPARNPEGARFTHSLDDVGRGAEVVVLSLPDGFASGEVCRSLAAVAGQWRSRTSSTRRRPVWTPPAPPAHSSRRPASATSTHRCRVRSSRRGSAAHADEVMFAAPDDDCAAVEPVLSGLSDRRIRVGAHPGMAQAAKLANNFLSASALAATSEAVAFGRSVGLDMGTMLDVLNASSGQNTATSDKFPNHVLNGRFASGFTNSLMSKDLRLYLGAVEAQGAPSALGPVTAAVWERFAEAEPGADFTRIYPFVEAAGPRGT